ncbi:MAG: preprotein translocase subunit YajC [Pseudomonadales bacterium]|nr:preprotein translocase subunit YajC [Pseudomonadales bacterium]MDP6471628.1 preprotein translocase subunit YajC [Pseudomonadales bacterium]MDP6970495.1 preprotein translocase subunit YajC [Pseudomonadales bacterium]|tara:strand:+ start:559 stop:903 length:345 start_codon:yes stop_codon:yes gene_type:complete
MNLFESVAHAAPAGGASGNAGLINILFLGGFVLIFYFLLIRPQSKRRKEHQALVGSLDKGDEVVTSGGIVGQVNKVEDDFLKIQVAPNMELRVQKSAVGATLPKGTLKSLDENK